MKFMQSFNRTLTFHSHTLHTSERSFNNLRTTVQLLVTIASVSWFAFLGVNMPTRLSRDQIALFLITNRALRTTHANERETARNSVQVVLVPLEMEIWAREAHEVLLARRSWTNNSSVATRAWLNHLLHVHVHVHIWKRGLGKILQTDWGTVWCSKIATSLSI